MDRSADKITAAPRGTAAASPALFALDPGNRSKLSDSCRTFTAAPATRRIILTGAVQSGKSTLAALLVKQLKGKSIPMAGILAKGLWENDQRAGFDLIDLKTGLSTPLARRSAPADGPRQAGNALSVPGNGRSGRPQGPECGSVRPGRPHHGG